jgi:transcriptional regulator with XRE-family HTH domain
VKLRLKSYIKENLRFLRNEKALTQQVMADTLNMTRVKYASYESGINKNPPIEDLMRISAYFKISIDSLLKVNLQTLSKQGYKELQAGNDSFMKGSKLRVIATTVDNENIENIEFVPIKAKAGYLNGYHDPDFVTKLPTFQLPVLKKDRKYRLFPITGDSMLPFPDRAFMIGEYVDNWLDIKNGEKCLVISAKEGFVLKEVYNNLKKDKTLLLKSTNPAYAPYSVNVEDILEIWQFAGYIDLQWPQQQFSTEAVLAEIDLLKVNILKIKPGVVINKGKGII